MLHTTEKDKEVIRKEFSSRDLIATRLGALKSTDKRLVWCNDAQKVFSREFYFLQSKYLNIILH